MAIQSKLQISTTTKIRLCSLKSLGFTEYFDFKNCWYNFNNILHLNVWQVFRKIYAFFVISTKPLMFWARFRLAKLMKWTKTSWRGGGGMFYLPTVNTAGFRKISLFKLFTLFLVVQKSCPATIPKNYNSVNKWGWVFFWFVYIHC